MPVNLTQALTWLQGPSGGLLLPLLLAVVMAVGDVRTRRIPNYLTLGGALAGLAFQTLVSGWPGLMQGLGGLAVGFGLMLPFYVFFGMGAGDVKAMAALGAWLTPWTSLSLFFYMALAGGVLGFGLLIWSGSLWQVMRSGWIWLANLVLTRGRDAFSQSESSPPAPGATMPYGVAIAAGMVTLLVVGPIV
jgi:prepilin peptidase CpaA